jgi:hypothetical protein
MLLKRVTKKHRVHILHERRKDWKEEIQWDVDLAEVLVVVDLAVAGSLLSLLLFYCSAFVTTTTELAVANLY